MSVLSIEIFAENLKKYIDSKGITQKELAEIIGVSAPTVNEWLMAKKYPRIDKIEKLANYFGILKSDLIDAKSEVNTEKSCLITIGEKIKQRRNELKWSQRELSDRMGYQNHSTITKIEAGQVDVPHSRIIQFSEVLGISIDYLMGDSLTIGEKIQQRRKEIGMSADELAEKIGKDRSTIYRYENGDIKKFPLDMLEPIANALNTTPAYLVSNHCDIGQKIKNARILHGLTQEQLGHLVGVQKSAIAKYENGRVINIKRNTLQKISKVLSINIEELVFDDLPINTTELHSKILTDFELLKSIQEYYELSDDDKKLIRDLISKLKNNN